MITVHLQLAWLYVILFAWLYFCSRVSRTINIDCFKLKPWNIYKKRLLKIHHPVLSVQSRDPLKFVGFQNQSLCWADGWEISKKINKQIMPRPRRAMKKNRASTLCYSGPIFDLFEKRSFISYCTPKKVMPGVMHNPQGEKFMLQKIAQPPTSPPPHLFLKNMAYS